MWIVSKDDDFRQRCFLPGPPPKVIRLPVGNAGTEAIRALLESGRASVVEFAADEDEAPSVLDLQRV